MTISAVAPPTSTTASETAGTTATVTNTPTGQAPQLQIGNVTVTPAGAVQSEAIANIVLAANSGSSFPTLCISLLAAGELNPYNPGQRSVLKRCDYLLHGAAYKYVASRVSVRPTPTSYSVSKNAARAQNPAPKSP